VDLNGFDAKAPPPKTQAFWDIVDSSRAPEDAEMADALDRLGMPAAVTLGAILTKAAPDFSERLRDRRNRRRIPHRLDECGYVPVRNPTANDGLWKIANKRRRSMRSVNSARGTKSQRPGKWVCRHRRPDQCDQ
jgi:hypothetical protein